MVRWSLLPDTGHRLGFETSSSSESETPGGSVKHLRMKISHHISRTRSD